MSIIFDALKRAEAQAQKGQTPTLASVRLAKVRSKARLWALASLFVLGLSVWWFISTSVKSSDTIASADVVKPSATAGEPLSDSVPQANLSLKETPAELQNPVVATDLSASSTSTSTSAALAARSTSTSEAKVGGGRLSVPSLDTPLTGAAQFDKKLEPVAVAPPVSPPAPSPAQPTPQLSEPKPAEAIAPPVPVAEVVPPATPPVVTPPAVAPEPALPSVFELDYKLRYELPKMAVSMYVYNAQPQFRFVIIGGKRYAEGELIESKVNITKIRADGLECEFQGTRFFYPRQSL